MVSVDELLCRHVSYQENVWSAPCSEPSVGEVLHDIRSGRYAAQVQRLRDLVSRGEQDQYSVDKKRLPGVTFSATFNGRRQVRELKEYNGLLVLDIDHLSKSDLVAADRALRGDGYVLACWTSPSEQGVKGLVGLSFSAENGKANPAARHSAAFAQVSSYFQQEYRISLDQSGSDITRLCFLSSDPDLHLRPGVVPFAVSAIPEPANTPTGEPAARGVEDRSTRSDALRRITLNRTEGKNNPGDRAAIGSIIKYLEKRGQSITATHDRWVRVAFAIADTFTYDVGKRYFLRLCRLDGTGHDEDGSARLLEDCYYTSRGQITFATVRHYAREAGYKGAL